MRSSARRRLNSARLPQYATSSRTSRQVRTLHGWKGRSRGGSGAGPETGRGALRAFSPLRHSASRLGARLEALRRMLRPTPIVPLAMKGMNLFAKLEYTNPIGSIKDRSAYWILKRAVERGEIGEATTVVESSSGNFASALAAFTNLIGLRFVPVIDPNISGTYESFLRRMCPRV